MKKLNWIKFENKIKEISLRIFTPYEISIIFNVSLRSVHAFFNYYLNKEMILKIKKNYYCLKSFIPSDFFIASFVYQPSYISLETTLSYYGIIPETTYELISITPKKTFNFKFNKKSFVYHRIKKEFFFGYQLKDLNSERFFLADKEKAILDYLYFCFLKKKILNDRLTIDPKKFDKKKLNQYLARFENRNFQEYVREKLKKIL